MRPEQKERDLRVWRLYCAGATQQVIADREGVSRQRISQIIERVRGQVPRLTADEIREGHLAQLDDIRVTMSDLMHAPGAPVTKTLSAGEGVSVLVEVKDPQSGELVREHGAKVAASREIVRAQARQAALLGLDAPERIEQQQKVLIEVVGIDIDTMR